MGETCQPSAHGPCWQQRGNGKRDPKGMGIGRGWAEKGERGAMGLEEGQEEQQLPSCWRSLNHRGI